MLILKHLKKQGKCKKLLAGKKMAAKFYWKWDFYDLKILRMKN